MIILLSPSKTMDFDYDSGRKGVKPLFGDQASAVASAINQLDHSEFKRIAKISDKVTDETLTKFARWGSGPKRPALWAYTGMVFSGLSARSMKGKDITFAQDHLRVLSAVYGYVRPLDLIEHYRLEMQTRLPVQGSNNLYEFWSDRIARSLLNDKPEFIVNLASEEYFKTIRPYLPDDMPIIAPKFLEHKNGALKDITITTKYMRGYFASWIIRRHINKPGQLQAFSDYYDLNSDLSTAHQPTFVKQPGWRLFQGRMQQL